MICIECGDFIDTARLMALPGAVRCMKCQALHEARPIANPKRTRRKEDPPVTNKIGNFKKLYRCKRCNYALNLDPHLKCAFCGQPMD